NQQARCLRLQCIALRPRGTRTDRRASCDAPESGTATPVTLLHPPIGARDRYGEGPVTRTLAQGRAARRRIARPLVHLGVLSGALTVIDRLLGDGALRGQHERRDGRGVLQR